MLVAGFPSVFRRAPVTAGNDGVACRHSGIGDPVACCLGSVRAVTFQAYGCVLEMLGTDASDAPTHGWRPWDFNSAAFA